MMDFHATRFTLDNSLTLNFFLKSRLNSPSTSSELCREDQSEKKPSIDRVMSICTWFYVPMQI